MKDFSLHRMSYSPGYGDMLGQYHGSTLRKGPDGAWIMVCTDRERHDLPKVTATYAVDNRAVAELATFIAEKNILSLEKRPQSNLFVTDYHPWGWHMDYDATTFGKRERKYWRIEEHQRYSTRDYKILNELRQRFEALRGEKLSETTEE